MVRRDQTRAEGALRESETPLYRREAEKPLAPARAGCVQCGGARAARSIYLEPDRRCVAPCALPWCEKRLRALMGAAPPTAPGVTVVRQLATLPAASIPSTSVRSVELYASVSSSSISARSRRSRWIVACEEKKRRCGEQAQVCAQGAAVKVYKRSKKVLSVPEGFLTGTEVVPASDP